MRRIAPRIGIAEVNRHGRDKRRKLNVRLLVLKWKRQGCQLCGYNKCTDALDPHHVTEDKESNISTINTVTMVERELKKCICLCANCHREVHAGMHPEIPIPNSNSKVRDISMPLLDCLDGE